MIANPRSPDTLDKEMDYEGVSILECVGCHGIFVSEDHLLTILNRKQVTFSEGIRHLARVFQSQPLVDSKNVILNLKDALVCPQCRFTQGKMRRMFFNAYYPVEIDKCPGCGMMWFDQDELEILQCLFEENNA